MAEAKITLTAQDKTKAAIQSAKEGLKGLQTSAVEVTGVLAGLGVTAWAANLIAGIRSTVNEWDELSKAAQRAGFTSAQSFAEFEYAAKLAGVGTQGLEAAVGKLAAKMADAAGGSKEAAAIFEAAGVKFKGASGELRATEDVLTDLANKFASWRDGPEKSALAMELFGKSGKDLIPLLNSGKTGLEQLRAEFRALRGELSDNTAKAAEQFNDNLTRLEVASGSLARSIAGPLLNSLVAITDKLAEAAKTHSLWQMTMAGSAELANQVTGGKFAGFLETKQLADLSAKVQQATKEVRSLEEGFRSGKLQGEYWVEQLKLARQVLDDLKASFRSADSAFRAARDPALKQDPSYSSLEAKRLAENDARQAAPVTRRPPAAEISAYKALNDEIQKRAALEEAEFQWGGKLSESRKFELDMLVKIEAATGKLTATQKARLVEAAKGVAKDIEANSAKERQIALAMLQGKAWEDEERAQADFAKKQDEREKGQMARAKSRLDQIEFETTLLTMNSEEREKAILLRELEESGIKKGTLAWETYAAAIQEATAKRSAVQRAVGDFQSAWELVDSTARDVWTNIERGGDDVFHHLADTLKSTVYAMLYKMTAQPFLLNIVANVTGTPLATAQAITGIGGGNTLASLSGASSVGNFLGFGGTLGTSLASASYAAAVPGLTSFGAGSQAAMLAAQTGEFGLAGLGATAAAGGGGVVGGIASTLGAIPGWGWAAMAAAALLGLGKGGETRVGGQYLNGTFLGGPSGGQINGAADMLTATMASINTALRTLGSSDALTNLFGALEQSKNGKGFAAAGGTLSSGLSFGQGQGSDWWDNRRGSMTAEQALAAYQAELQQATLQAIQAATDIPKSIDSKLSGLDIDALSDSAVKSLYDDIAGSVAAVSQFRLAVQALPFQNLAALSFDAANGLIAFAGGIDNLRSGMQAYYDNFFTEAERRANSINQITQVLTSAGLDITAGQVATATKEMFQAWMNAADPATEAGQRAAAALYSVAGAMGALINSTQQQRNSLETQILQLQGNTAALRARELADITDAYNRGLQIQIYALTDAKAAAEAAGATAALSGSLSDGAARAAADAAAATAKESRDQLEAQRQVLQETQSNLKSVFDLLRTSVRSLYGEVGTLTLSAARGQAFIQRALGAARQGFFPDQEELAAAISAARGGLISDNYGSQLEMDRARIRLAGQLSELQELTGDQLTTTEKQLKAAEDQLALMDQVAQNSAASKDSLASIAGSSATTAQYLSALGDAVQSALAAGLNPGTKNIATLADITPNTWKNGYYTSAAGAGLAQTAKGVQIAGLTGGLYTQQQVVDFANAKIAAGDMRGLYDRLRSEGISLATFDELMQQPADWSESFARSMGWPVFDVGTNRVLKDGPAWLHKDEAVVPKAYNPAVNARAMGAMSDNSAQAELRAIRAALDGLRDDQRAQMRAVLKNQGKGLDVLDNWNVNGLPEERQI